jgi:hypothetical protein
MSFSASWNAVEGALAAVAEHRAKTESAAPLSFLHELNLAVVGDGTPGLTPLGEKYYMARFVLADEPATRDALRPVLMEQPVATAFCVALWGTAPVPVSGAVSLLLRLRVGDEAAAKRWLELMNRAGWIVYNRKNPKVRVVYNPSELVPPDEEEGREQSRGHLISPDTPFGNLLALREMVRAARTWIWWYEQHMPAKVLEVLYKEADGAKIDEIKLLSGPANVDDAVKSDFKRFHKEMLDKRGVAAEWRVLSKKRSFEHHDRFFFTDGMSRNLPPLNTILAGSTGEILPSDLDPAEFTRWWSEGVDLRNFQPAPQ